MDEKQNKRKNRSDDDRQNPVFLMVHKTVENNHFYCGLLLLMFMSIVTGYCSVRPEIPIYLGNIMKIYAIVSGMGFIISLAMAALDIIICALEFVNNLRLNLQDEGEHKNIPTRISKIILSNIIALLTDGKTIRYESAKKESVSPVKNSNQST